MSRIFGDLDLLPCGGQRTSLLALLHETELETRGCVLTRKHNASKTILNHEAMWRFSLWAGQVGLVAHWEPLNGHFMCRDHLERNLKACPSQHAETCYREDTGFCLAKGPSLKSTSHPATHTTKALTGEHHDTYRCGSSTERVPTDTHSVSGSGCSNPISSGNRPVT